MLIKPLQFGLVKPLQFGLNNPGVKLEALTAPVIAADTEAAVGLGASVTVAGTYNLPGTATYQWKRDGAVITGADASTYNPFVVADAATDVTVVETFTSDDGQVLTQESNALTPTLYLAESSAFFTLASVTDAAAKGQLNQFALGAKQLGIWDNLLYVPCRSALGGLYQFGGASQLTADPWTIAGDFALGAFGITGTGPTDSGGDYCPNRLVPRQSFASANYPIFYGVVGSQDASDILISTKAYGRHGAVRQSASLQAYGYGASPNFGLYGAGGGGSYLLAIAAPITYRNRNRPGHIGRLAPAAAGQAAHRTITANHYSAGVGTFAGAQGDMGTNFCFCIPAGSGQAGTLHGAWMFYGDPENYGGNAVWSRIWALIQSTMLADMETKGHVRVGLSGQSNAAGIQGYLQNENVAANNYACGELFYAAEGGVAITNWVGAGVPARTADYERDFHKSDGTGLILDKHRPLNGIGTWEEWVTWFHGESDSETQELTDAYKARLQAMIGWWRTDSGNSNLKACIVKIGYHYSYRSGAAQADFTVSGLTGDATDLNGAWACTALANEVDPYEWTKAGYTLAYQNSRWEFVRDADAVVMVHSDNDRSHPQLVSGWTTLVGGGAPVIPTTRTGRIEGIRQVQQEVADEDALAIAVDARPSEYNAGDVAHLTAAGAADCASRIWTAIQAA